MNDPEFIEFVFEQLKQMKTDGENPDLVHLLPAVSAQNSDDWTGIALKLAIEMGDLRENAEYQTAKERQSIVQTQLGQKHFDVGVNWPSAHGWLSVPVFFLTEPAQE